VGAVGAGGIGAGAVAGVGPRGAAGGPAAVPEQRALLVRHRSDGAAPTGTAGGGDRDGSGGRFGSGAARTAGGRLRVDARRNLESVLRAARDVFGELGYGAPMEEVARRAGVGVGTVYRRFPSKEVLVRRIAAEEVAWLTAQAREALHGNPDPWGSLAGYLARSVATGAGRLLPPEALRQAEELAGRPAQTVEERSAAWSAAPATDYAAADYPAAGTPEGGEPIGMAESLVLSAFEAVTADPVTAEPWPDADPLVLLGLLGALVDRAAGAGELRPGVTVADVVLVLTAAVPSYPRPMAGRAGEVREAPPSGSETPADRLLRILLNGLRAR
jgi:AcrR family transcriptional regulator